MSNISSKDEKQPHEKKLSGIEIPDPRGDFNKLDESQKKEVIRRAKLLFNELGEMYKDPVFFGLTYRTNIGQIMRLFIEQDKPVANLIYHTLHKIRAEAETEEAAFEMDESIKWLRKIMHLLNIEIDTVRFSPEMVTDYVLANLENMGILAVSEDGVQRTLEPSESIIWNLLMAKAENVYGIRLMNSGSPAKWEVLESLCDILRDELIRLDKNKKDGEEKFKDLISELEILSEYWLFRYCHDTGWDDDDGSKELTSRETISILGNVSEKAVVNAGLKGEIEIKKITLKEDREPVTYYQTDSALEWLQDQKRRHKFNYLPSLKASNKYEDRDNFLVIPAESIEELGRFIDEHSPGWKEEVDENIRT